MKVINLAPHDVDICDKCGNVIKTYKASGIVARVAYYNEIVGTVDGVPIIGKGNGRVVGLPEPQEDTLFIVSTFVLDYCTDRTDLIAPACRVKIDGRIVGCQSFMSNARKS